MFTAVIPTYDRPELLKRALDSVLRQSLPPSEIIVVDNGTVPVDAAELPDSVRVLRIEARAGASRARNTGAEAATTDYVAFLDDDDEWAPDYLERMHQAIAAEDAPPDMLIGRKDLIIDGERRGYKRITEIEGLLSALLVRNPGIGGQNTVVRRAAFMASDRYDASLRNSQDRALALDFLLAGKVVVPVPEAAALVHRGRDDHLSDSPGRVRARRLYIRKYRHAMSWRERFEANARWMHESSRWQPWPLAPISRLAARVLRRLART